MPDFPTKQILLSKIKGVSIRETWHFVKFPNLYSEDKKPHASEIRADIHEFVRYTSEGRFFIERVEGFGYWFEDPNDAMIFKLRFC